MLFAYLLFRSSDGIGPGTDVIVPALWYRCWCTYAYGMEMENRFLSQICGRLYFPIFLFRVELFTLMYIDSLIVLARLFSSLAMILKLFNVVTWPLLFWCRNIGEGAFKCSLYLSPKVLPDSPIYSSSQSISPYV